MALRSRAIRTRPRCCRWAQTPQYAGISSKLQPDQIARQNWEIEQAKSKLSDYRKQYKDAAESRLRRDDPQAYRLSQRDRLDSEILDRKKRAIDKATGGRCYRPRSAPPLVD